MQSTRETGSQVSLSGAAWELSLSSASKIRHSGRSLSLSHVTSALNQCHFGSYSCPEMGSARSITVLNDFPIRKQAG
jgi:hypothetical protein